MDTRSQFVNSHALQTCLNPSENKLCSFVLSNCIFFLFNAHLSYIHQVGVGGAIPSPHPDIIPYCFVIRHFSLLSFFFFNYPPGRNCGKIEKRKTNPEMGTCKWTVHFFFERVNVSLRLYNNGELSFVASVMTLQIRADLIWCDRMAAWIKWQ